MKVLSIVLAALAVPFLVGCPAAHYSYVHETNGVPQVTTATIGAFSASVRTAETDKPVLDCSERYTGLQSLERAQLCPDVVLREEGRKQRALDRGVYYYGGYGPYVYSP